MLYDKIVINKLMSQMVGDMYKNIRSFNYLNTNKILKLDYMILKKRQASNR